MFFNDWIDPRQNTINRKKCSKLFIFNLFYFQYQNCFVFLNSFKNDREILFSIQIPWTPVLVWGCGCSCFIQSLKALHQQIESGKCVFSLTWLFSITLSVFPHTAHLLSFAFSFYCSFSLFNWRQVDDGVGKSMVTAPSLLPHSAWARNKYTMCLMRLGLGMGWMEMNCDISSILCTFLSQEARSTRHKDGNAKYNLKAIYIRYFMLLY